MWKNFFYFSKSERRVILLLTVTLGLLCIATPLVWHIRRQNTVTIAEPDSIDAFIAGLTKQKQPSKHRYASREREEVIVEYHDFDPNKADSVELRRLGLPSFIAHNILRYRAKGGVFRNPQSLARIYGLSDEAFKTLEPYIVISEEYTRKPIRQIDTVMLREEKEEPRYPVKLPEGTVVDLNEADTTLLRQIPGIGSALSKMIVDYRERLGGYASVEQVLEVNHVDASMCRWFKVGTPSLRQLRVNHDGLDRLRRHPYMDFYKAKAIIEYRRKRGQIKSLSRIALFEEFSEKDLKKLQPYLSFE